MNNKPLTSLIVGLLIAIFVVVIWIPKGIVTQQPLGNASATAYANSTTTDANWNPANNPSKFRLLKTGYGILGCVIVTGATQAVEMNFFDGTSTVSHANYATSTLYKQNLSTPANTYCPNISYSRGLIVEFPTALGAASSTIVFD